MTLRKTTITNTARSTYIVMTEPPIFLWSMRKRSSSAFLGKTARSRTSRKSANPALTPFLEPFQDVPGVHARGDKLRAIFHHCGEHAFSLQVHECHATHVHHAFVVSIRAMRLFPTRFELRNPGAGKPALQSPSLPPRLVSNRGSQHCRPRSRG
jgi:hypothetical protein